MAAPPVCAGQPLRSGARSCQRAIIAMICHGGAIGPSRRTRAAEAIPSTDTASASAEPARTIAGSIGSNLWAEMVPWTRSHSARALTRRIQPRTVSAGTPRSAPIVRWPWPKALASKGMADDVDHVAATRGCQRGQQHVGHPATGAADPSRPQRYTSTSRAQRTGPGEAPASQLPRAAKTPQPRAPEIGLRLPLVEHHDHGRLLLPV